MQVSGIRVPFGHSVSTARIRYSFDGTIGATSVVFDGLTGPSSSRSNTPSQRCIGTRLSGPRIAPGVVRAQLNAAAVAFAASLASALALTQPQPHGPHVLGSEWAGPAVEQAGCFENHSAL